MEDVADFTTNIRRELAALKTPPKKELSPVPIVGQPAPPCPELHVPCGKPTIIVFLRHCGDPFAEKIFKHMANLSTLTPQAQFVAVSHSDKESTDRWVAQVGGAWDVDVVIDTDRDLYARWGLGMTTYWQLLNPGALYSTLDLGYSQGIWGRTIESGSRWQNGGAFGIDAMGVIRWVHLPPASDDIIYFEPCYEALKLEKPALNKKKIKN